MAKQGDSWRDDHDEWLAQFNEMVNEALNVDPETPLEGADELAMSDIAAKLMNGKITIGDAVRRVAEWIAGRHGFKITHDDEAFKMELDVGGYIEITAECKINLLTAGEIGIADGILNIYAQPSVLVVGPGDVADIENPPAIAMHLKGWFQPMNLNPTEVKNLLWAVQAALQSKLSAG